MLFTVLKKVTITLFIYSNAFSFENIDQLYMFLLSWCRLQIYYWVNVYGGLQTNSLYHVLNADIDNDDEQLFILIAFFIFWLRSIYYT